MSWTESAFTFGCKGESLIGIMSLPGLAGSDVTSVVRTVEADTGVVVIVGGPQYRAGSHRQFTLLARAVADAGYPVLRFDYRGMGDSTGVPRTFDAVQHDIAAAIDLMQQQLPTVQRVILWGLCDGASAALLYLQATSDPRISGVCIANPWVRNEVSLARTHLKHYYLQRLRQPEFWRRALSGQLAENTAIELWRNLRRSVGQSNRPGVLDAERIARFQERMVEAASRFGGRLLLLISGNDLTAKEFLDQAQTDGRWQSILLRDSTARVDFPGADHTFSAIDDAHLLHRTFLGWLAATRGSSQTSALVS
jgi:uncharacterized protein